MNKNKRDNFGSLSQDEFVEAVFHVSQPSLKGKLRTCAEKNDISSKWKEKNQQT
jgi:hypothetical protein